jgi:hypothetical protein
VIGQIGQSTLTIQVPFVLAVRVRSPVAHRGSL